MGCEWFKACHSKFNKEYFCSNDSYTGCNFDYTNVGPCSNQFVVKDQCMYTQEYSELNCSVNDEHYKTRK